MEFTFRCNITKCRTELQHQAVVTTCSHIFCVQCASNSGLANPVGGARICPACKAQLVNKDDAVITQLDPSEDYKTSVLSGFTPTLVVECASRALNFYNYQAVHEATYQEFLARRLTEKVTGLNAQLDDTINNANGHIVKLQDALRDSQARIDQLQNQHAEIQMAFKQKTKALTDVTRKYDQLKDEKNRARTLNDASDEADHVFQGIIGTHPGAHVDDGMDSGNGGQVNMTRLHSVQRHPTNPGRGLPSRGFGAPPGTGGSPTLMTPSAPRQSYNITGASRSGQTMTADGSGGGGYRQPLGNVPTNFTRQSASGYGMTAAAKAGRRPMRAFTPQANRFAEGPDIPMR